MTTTEFQVIQPSVNGNTGLSLQPQKKEYYSSLETELRSNPQFNEMARKQSYNPSEIGYVVGWDGTNYWVRLIENESDPGLRFSPDSDLRALLERYSGQIKEPTKPAPAPLPAPTKQPEPSTINPLAHPNGLGGELFSSSAGHRRGNHETDSPYSRPEAAEPYKLPSQDPLHLARLEEMMRSQQAETRDLRNVLGKTNSRLEDLIAVLETQSKERRVAPIDGDRVGLLEREMVDRKADIARLEEQIRNLTRAPESQTEEIDSLAKAMQRATARNEDLDGIIIPDLLEKYAELQGDQAETQAENNRLQEELAALQSQKAENEAAQQTLQAQLEEANDGLNSVKEGLTNLIASKDEKDKEFLALQNERDALVAQLAELEGSIEQKEKTYDDEIAGLKEEAQQTAQLINELGARIEGLEKITTELSEQIAALEASESDQQDLINELTRQNDELEATLAQAQGTSADLEARFAKKGVELTEAARQQAELQAQLEHAGVTGEELESALSAAKQQVTDLSQELDALQTDKSKADADLAALKKEYDENIAALVKTQAEIERLKASTGEQQTVLQDVRNDLEQKEADLDATSQALTAAQAKVEDLDTQAAQGREDNAQLEADLQSAQTQVTQLQAEVAALQAAFAQSEEDRTADTHD